ncbi:hypothetical protein HZB96_04245 [Candidatus Gottesmanbacteria bacterium]|nr:hypothetical protein [Candidatus Gottesmanbacteria bacterium]MBI5451938.1 hypothetical protein [Candidatus Gottesmanbacteria bacterium]
MILNVLTQKDLEEIDKIVDGKIKFLPTKKEFFSKMDALMKEIKDLREEVTIVTSYKDQIEDHETRIVKIEEVLQPQSS